MTEPEFSGWLAQAVPAYAADKVASGQWAAEASLELSKKEYEELLPQGLASQDQHLFMIVDAQATAVGILWFAVKTKFNAPIAYVFDIEIASGRRREGHAFRAFVALEDVARELGLTGTGLHVFGHNKGAQALYAKLGFEPTNISLFKPIAEHPAADAV